MRVSKMDSKKKISKKINLDLQSSMEINKFLKIKKVGKTSTKNLKMISN